MRYSLNRDHLGNMDQGKSSTRHAFVNNTFIVNTCCVHIDTCSREGTCSIGMQSGASGGWQHASAEGAVCKGVPHQRSPAYPYQFAGHAQRPGLQGEVTADTEVSAQPASLLFPHSKVACVTMENAVD